MTRFMVSVFLLCFAVGCGGPAPQDYSNEPEGAEPDMNVEALTGGDGESEGEFDANAAFDNYAKEQEAATAGGNE